MALSSHAQSGGHEALPGRRIFLVRHGETTGQSSQRFWGATDVPLSELGERQVQGLWPYLEGHQFDAVVSSPMKRARRSLEVMASLGPDHFGDASSWRTYEGLREVNFGRIEGLTIDEIREQEPDWAAAWDADDFDGFPDGETIRGFAERVAGGVDQALADAPAGDLLLVAHRGVIKNALCHLLRLDRSVIRPWSLDLASLTTLTELPGGGWALDRYNLTGSVVPLAAPNA